MPDSTLSTLDNIRIKIRRVTKSPSTAQITKEQLDDYINTFILYDLPQNLKIDALNNTLTFYTQPDIDLYENETADIADPLYNFNNRYSLIENPVYVAGRQIALTLSEEDFYNNYPKIQSKINIGTGNNAITHFDGTLSEVPILRNSINVSSIDVNGNSLEAHDNGNYSFVGDVTGINFIDYLNGAYIVDFTIAPAINEPVRMQTYTYTAAMPNMVLYHNGAFRFRPVPDASYKVEIATKVRPTELLLDSDIPELAQWWQYIALGASIKIFQDRMDYDSAAKITQEFEHQEILINRRTILQNSGKQAKTIYNS